MCNTCECRRQSCLMGSDILPRSWSVCFLSLSVIIYHYLSFIFIDFNTSSSIKKWMTWRSKIFYLSFKEGMGDEIENFGEKTKQNYMLGDIWGILQILPHSITFLIESSQQMNEMGWGWKRLSNFLKVTTAIKYGKWSYFILLKCWTKDWNRCISFL